MKTEKIDLENYYKMSEPFESPDEINKAIAEFNIELGELRKKYKIADMLVVLMDSVKYATKTGQIMITLTYGNSLNVPIMAAYAHGQAQVDSREMINKLMANQK